jgi:hypothetical protein
VISIAETNLVILFIEGILLNLSQTGSTIKLRTAAALFVSEVLTGIWSKETWACKLS